MKVYHWPSTSFGERWSVASDVCRIDTRHVDEGALDVVHEHVRPLASREEVVVHGHRICDRMSH